MPDPGNLVARAARQLEPGTLIELFELDITPQGGGHYYYHPYTDLAPNTIVFQGKTYHAWPIKAEGWDYNTRGTMPRPVITASNIGGAISQAMRLYNDFNLCIVTRRRTYANFLDTGPDADPTQEFPADIFVIDRKKTETNTVVEFELSTPMDAEGILLPGRQIIAHLCVWPYRNPDCSYTGAPVADNLDNALVATTDRGAYNSATTYAAGDYAYTTISGVRIYWVSLVGSNTAPLTDANSWVMDSCGKGLNSCRMRFGGIASLSRHVVGWFVSHCGTGYHTGDVLTAVGGVFTSPAVWLIDHPGTGGSICFGDGADKHITDSGDYSVIPRNPVPLSGGSGSGAKIDLNWSSIATVGGTPLPTSAFPGASKVIG